MHFIGIYFKVCFLCVQVRSRDQLILQLRAEMKTAEQKHQRKQEQVWWLVCVCMLIFLSFTSIYVFIRAFPTVFIIWFLIIKYIFRLYYCNLQ